MFCLYKLTRKLTQLARRHLNYKSIFNRESVYNLFVRTNLLEMEDFMVDQLLENLLIDSSSSKEEEFDNELQSMKEFFATGHEQREIIIQDFLKRQQPINAEEMKKKSNALRDKGNLIMRTSNGDICQAAILYTQAITAAPIGSEALAFAHANRSLALMRLNYLESAYDDCLCALEEGYPVAMRYKIFLRQAEVAKELGNLEKMKRHISELEAIKLETREIEKLEKLKTALSELEANETLSKEKEITIEDRKQEKSFEKPFKIVKTVGQKQRSMIATKPIKKGDTIFTDHAFAFVCEKPGEQICNHCANSMIVPFPCVRCSVVYCSLKCKQYHERVHTYECSLIKNGSGNILDYLPFRMLLEGFPEILPYLNQKRDAQSLWSECFENKKMKNLKYIQILRSTSGWSTAERARKYLAECVLKAQFLAIYLKNCTKFFESLSDTAASSKDWKIFIAAIILRHWGQISIGYYDKADIKILLNPLSSRVERGQLFKMFSKSCDIYKFFPTLFICNHECTPAFEKKFDGRYMKAVAVRDFKVGDEINDNYIGQSGIPMFSKEERQNMLMEGYHFKCQCMECQGPDKKFKEYHQFWCENSNCKKPYSAESRVAMNGGLRCPHCRKQQVFNYKEEIKLITMLGKTLPGRSALFDRYDKMQRKFKDFNINKAILVPFLINACLESHFEHDTLTSSELDKLHNMNLSFLEYPIEMLAKLNQFLGLSLLWDVIALRGKKIRINDLGNSLNIVNEFEIKERTMCLEYYKDFVAPLIE